MRRRSFIGFLFVVAMIFCFVASSGAEQSVYTGSAQGFGSQVKVEVTLENDKVVGLKVDDFGESYTMAGVTRENSVEKVIKAILASGGTEGVDALSGATATSKAVLAVVNEALAGGKADLSGVKISYKPGTYTGHGKGRAGDIEVNVTVNADKIEAINVGKNGETVGVKDLAFVGLRDEILANQSLGVNAVSGATMTSNGFLAAVTDALTQASDSNVVAALKTVPVEHKAPSAEDRDTQVVVVGAGMSGLIAALTAAQLGADVILVEKMPFVGGNLFLAGGGLGTVGSEVVEEFDDLDRTLAYFKMVNETSERQPDYDFIAKMLPETGRAIDWLAKDFGLYHKSSDRGDYVRTNFGTPEDVSGSAFAKQLEKLIDKQGVTVLLNTRAQHIVMDNGKAVGIAVSNESGNFVIRAKKVILATGGASRNWERLTKANPELNIVKYFEEAAVSSTGDGFDMMEEIGAKMDVGPFVKSAYPDISIAFGYTFRNSPTQQNQLVVNAEGKRVANESPYNQMFFNKQMLRQASPAYYAIYEPSMMPDYFRADADRLAANEDNSVVVKAGTLKELADKMGVNYETLRATFDRYNKLCAEGKDTDFGKDASHMIAYSETGPLYAVRVYTASWGTIGGAVTDDTFHVIDAKGRVIENLFAIGECATARLFGDYYFGGFSLGFYTAAGHIAGEEAVKEINGNLVIKKQGVFSSGGTVTEPLPGEFNVSENWLDFSRSGNTAHVDHANTFYQIPDGETKSPIVYLHGYGQSRMGWQTTPDGREGWSDIFLRKGRAAFLVDQPRRGAAGSTVNIVNNDQDTRANGTQFNPGDQAWYTHFRIGRGTPNRYDGSQFPAGEEALNQFLRQMTVNTGNFDAPLFGKALSAVLSDVRKMTGKKVVYMTHSAGGRVGWQTDTENMAAIVAIEPGFAPEVGSDVYKKFVAAKIPMIFYFGDYIENGPTDIKSTAFWKSVLDQCRDFAKHYNEDGGDATVIYLPDEGITGNSHFMFQELNNKQIAEHIEKWLREKGL